MAARIESEVELIRAHTSAYVNDPAFRRRWYGLSDVSIAYRAQKLRMLGRMLGDKWDSLAGKRVLDVGCGNGSMLRWFVELGMDPEDGLGVDVSDERFQEGLKKNPLIRMMKTDGITIPCESNYYDLVTQFTCFMCIPSLDFRRRVANEMMRVLKPGGYIFWWDVPASGVPGVPPERLCPRDYFSGMPMSVENVSMMPRPSEAVRPLRGIGPLIGPILNVLGYPHSHVAALIGPKRIED